MSLFVKLLLIAWPSYFPEKCKFTTSNFYFFPRPLNLGETDRDCLFNVRKATVDVHGMSIYTQRDIFHKGGRSLIISTTLRIFLPCTEFQNLKIH